LELVFNSIPNDRLFLETDTIEQDISEVYQLAAKYKNIEVEEMKTIINTNFTTVFNRINKK
jgi:TatD DNase family protein